MGLLYCSMTNTSSSKRGALIHSIMLLSFLAALCQTFHKILLSCLEWYIQYLDIFDVIAKSGSKRVESNSEASQVKHYSVLFQVLEHNFTKSPTCV